MTNPTAAQEPALDVAQEDRDGAADLAEWLAGITNIGGNDVAAIRNGVWDDDTHDLGVIVQAFARHRHAALASARAREAWQPIESAPRDGLPILLAFRSEYTGEIIVREGGFCEESGIPSVTDSDYLSVEPIAWRPLPEPPALAKPADEGEVK